MAISEQSPFTSTGLVRELADYILERSDTNPSFAETCAASLVATACGPNVIISDVKGDVPFNIFGVVVGGSGITNKTVALDIVRDIIRLLSEEIGEDLNLPQKFSIEGMSKYLIKNPEGLSAGDEYTAMFQAKSKTWLNDSMEFLSTLYDGWIPKYVTIVRGMEYVESVYVNFLSATTFYLLRLMKTDDFFLQGTGNRFLWDVDYERSEIEITDHDVSSFFLDREAREKREEELMAFVHRLARLREVMTRKASDYAKDGKCLLILDLESIKLLGTYRLEKINQATRIFQEDILNPDTGYVARLAQNAIKLAGIHAVGRNYMELINSAEADVLPEDVEWAINKVEHHLKMYHKLKEIRDQLHADFSTRGHQTDFQKVMSAIEVNSGKANITQIMQRTGWLKKDAWPILESMITTEMIEAKIIKPKQSKEHQVYVTFGTKIPWVEKNLVGGIPSAPICSKCNKPIEGIPSFIGTEMVCGSCVPQ